MQIDSSSENAEAVRAEVKALPPCITFEQFIGRKDGLPCPKAFGQVMEDAYYIDGGAGDTNRNMYRNRLFSN